jgi:hypothetical protein
LFLFKNKKTASFNRCGLGEGRNSAKLGRVHFFDTLIIMDIHLNNLWHEYQTTQFLLTQQLAADSPFAIITAHNPRGRLLSPCQNRLLDRQLQREIEMLRCPYRALVGAAKDLSHMEKSWALLTDKETAVALGRRFEQYGIYYVAHGELTLVPCLAEAPEITLGAFNHRMTLVNELPELNA